MGTTPLLKSADHSRDFASVFDCLINVCAFDQAINSKMLGAQSNIFSRCLLSACWRSEWILNRHTELNRHIELIRAWWVLVCWLKVRLAEAVWDPLKAVCCYPVLQKGWNGSHASLANPTEQFIQCPQLPQPPDGVRTQRWLLAMNTRAGSLVCNMYPLSTRDAAWTSWECRAAQQASTCSGLGDSCAEAPPPSTRWWTLCHRVHICLHTNMQEGSGSSIISSCFFLYLWILYLITMRYDYIHLPPHTVASFFLSSWSHSPGSGFQWLCQ